ncbi:tpr repeat protein [Niveomyces insectorum RCEF 264]|uniref:Tpr repeat protein n=1 Tax=Niveomyces insectorum RCEF 264 TaxID=1081102 RepID=A0A167Y1P5_9HYPO|nr:tpr repeat protein [Niveomyces insectorum RCEF 264]
MVRLQEISDEVADKLKLAEVSSKKIERDEEANTATTTPETEKIKKGQGPKPTEETGAAAPGGKSAAAPKPAPSAASATPSGPGPAPAPTEDAAGAKAGPELPPVLGLAAGKTVDEILADLNKSPLFMTELEENDDVAALQALAYEGTPLENATDFKERGNECFRERKWTDARTFYDKGISLLVGEDRRRARGEPPKPVEKETGETAPAQPEPDSPADVAQQHTVLEQLYANRAACQLALRNYRACTLDCGAALRLRPANTKAWFRSAQALLALDKTDEASAACAGGLAADPEDERHARAARKAQRLRAVLRARRIRTRSTEQTPDLEDAAVRLDHPEDDGAVDFDASKSVLTFPTVLLYPLTLQSDFVKAFAETECLNDHLAYILPPPWDTPSPGSADKTKTAGEYSNAAAVDCYMETAAGGLVKVGKKMALGTILGQANVEVVDDIVRVFVVPRGKADAWVREFKSKRAAERGGA